jgi:hypothetical protein
MYGEEAVISDIVPPCFWRISMPDTTIHGDSETIFAFLQIALASPSFRSDNENARAFAESLPPASSADLKKVLGFVSSCAFDDRMVRSPFMSKSFSTVRQAISLPRNKVYRDVGR